MNARERAELTAIADRLRGAEALATLHAGIISPGDLDVDFVARNAFVRGSLAGTCERAANEIDALTGKAGSWR